MYTPGQGSFENLSFLRLSGVSASVIKRQVPDSLLPPIASINWTDDGSSVAIPDTIVKVHAIPCALISHGVLFLVHFWENRRIPLRQAAVRYLFFGVYFRLDLTANGRQCLFIHVDVIQQLDQMSLTAFCCLRQC